MQPQSRREQWAALLLLAGALAFLSLQLRIGLDLQDEGLLCDYASRILRGERPYLDFEPPYEAGRYLVLAGLFRVFGESVIVERAAFLLLLALAAVLTFLLARRVLPLSLSLLPPLFLLLAPGPLWKLELHFAAALAVLAAQRYGERPSAGRALCAGAVIGALAWDRPDLPVLAALLLCLSRALSPPCKGRPLRPDVGRAALAAGAVLFPLLLWIAVRGGGLRSAAAAHLWMTRLHQFAPPFALPWQSPQGLWNGAFVFVGPPLALIAAAMVLRARRRGALSAGDLLLALLALAAALSWNQIRVRPNFSHALQAAWPVWLLGPALAFRALGALRGGWKALAVPALLVWPVCCWQAVLTMPTYPGLLAVRAGRAQRSGWPRADVWLPPRVLSALDASVGYLRGRPGPALIGPYAPMLGFIAGTPSPAFLDNLLPGRLSPDDEDRLIAALERTRTTTVLRVDEPGEPSLEENAPRLWRYVEERYQGVGQRGVAEAFERRQ